MVKSILPEVHRSNPSVSLLIAGINPAQSVLNLQSDKVNVIPHFENIRDAFAMSRINMAPMLISIGLQNKIIQAMAMKMPTVCSLLANNAVKAVQGESIYAANSPAEYVKYINDLLSDPNKARQMGENSYHNIIS